MKLPPDPDFRPSPNRAVFLNGLIDQPALDRLFPEILRIQGSEPITLYIDSPGGRTLHAARLQQMLAAPTQDSKSRRRLITVATGFVASAAADLLIAGDYTLAYEHAVIMMHGVRQSSDTDITTEAAANLARSLASSNEQFALQLAANCVSTFFFRVAGTTEHFDTVRKETGKLHLSDIECFVLAASPRVSGGVRKLLEDALKQCVEMAQLYASVSQALAPMFAGRETLPRHAEVEASIFRAILDYELRVHPEPEWSFGDRGFEALQQKAQLLIDQTNDRHNAQVATLQQRWQADLLTPEEAKLVIEAPREMWADKTKFFCEPRIREFWFLLVAICRGLQTADFYLSAEEAYWLGFIDEVIGRLDLSNPRIFAEYTPDEDPKEN